MRHSQFALACLAGFALNAHAGVTITNQTALNITATTAQLRADATEAGGSTYSAYFEYGDSTGYGTLSPTQTGVVAPNLTSRVLSSTISGLTCGTMYHFRLVVPTGATGSDSTFSTTPCSATLTLTRSAGTSPSQYGSSVSYSATLAGATNPTGNVNFMVNGTSIDGCSAVALSGNTAQCTTTSLAAVTNASVTAKYANDVLNYSVTSNALTQTVTAAAPGLPIGPVATPGNASATVSFSAPLSNGGSAITGYTVTSSPAGGTDQNAGSTSLTHTITGLTNGTAYTFTVTATNSAGAGGASAASAPVTPTSGSGGGGVIPQLSVTVTGIKTMPQPLDLTAGQGPAFVTALMTQLAKALNNDHLMFDTQNAIGVVKVMGYGPNGSETLAFTVLDYQTGDTRADGIYTTGNGSYKLVRSGASITLAPAVMSLPELTALYPGVSATITNNGTIIAPIGDVTYVAQPSISVQQHFPATATANLMPGTDGIPTFTNKNNEAQRLYPGFAEPDTLRNALKNIDPNATMNVQFDGTVAARVNGANYTLVPDQTLGAIPSSQVGRMWWQDSPSRYHLLNITNAGTSQGLTVKQ